MHDGIFCSACDNRVLNSKVYSGRWKMDGWITVRMRNYWDIRSPICHWWLVIAENNCCNQDEEAELLKWRSLPALWALFLAVKVGVALWLTVGAPVCWLALCQPCVMAGIGRSKVRRQESTTKCHRPPGSLPPFTWFAASCNLSQLHRLGSEFTQRVLVEFRFS